LQLPPFQLPPVSSVPTISDTSNAYIARRLTTLLSAALPLLLVTACGGKDDSAQAATPGGGPGGGRGGPSVVLAATDVAPVRRGPIEAGVAVTGDLRPIETVEVRARLEGDLEGVYVREGDRVAQGQLLARFEASEQESARRSAEADREAARAALSTAQWNLEQSQELFKAGAVPERDVRTSSDAVSAARARLSAAESAVRAASSNAGDTRVLAPTSGIIETRVVENGMHVSRSAPMFTLVKNDVLELAASVPARFASDVRAGQLAKFTADGRQIDGRVARVSPTVDPQTRAVTVYVQIPNASGTLKGNTFAQGRVVGRTIPDAVLVPLSAVRELPDDAGRYVFRIVNDKVQRTNITTGVVDEAAGVAEVTDGLQPGDRVIAGNVGTVGDGMKATIVGEGKDQRGGAGGVGGAGATGTATGAARTQAAAPGRQ
jgi:RND family efflux transporter MFP subunit